MNFEKMNLKIYQIDAFTDKVFGGNPAAVIPLREWLPDNMMLKIAMENNLSETAFFVAGNDGFHIRWFTPSVEVDLCGHATLAASHVLFQHLGWSQSTLEFNSRRGKLTVSYENGIYLLDFPADVPEVVGADDNLLKCFDSKPSKILKGMADYLMVFDDEEYVRHAKPNLSIIEKLEAEGVIITAPGAGKIDFVSRFFAPALGIPEDPVTGSAHTVLVPYWSTRLGKQRVNAQQVSQRGGELKCRLNRNRVEIGGKAVTFLVGEITV